MTQHRPTIHDVARDAGVSKSTVSLVLQASPQVKAETREAVRQSMARIGYVYNRSAANLRSSRVGLIGLVINDLRNPFFTEFATSIQMALSERGFATVIANTDEDPGLQAQVVASMIEHGVSALVISPVYAEGAAGFDLLARAGMPVLQVLRKSSSDFPFSAPDFAKGGRLAALHLMMRGAKRIAFAGGVEGRPVTLERMEGYRDVMAQTGQKPLILNGRASRAFGRKVGQELTRDHPDVDGVICFNDLVALGILSGAAELGRKVGPEFRVVGFDDIEECEQCFPKLTSVHCDVAGFGRNAAEMMLNWLEDGTAPAAETRSDVRLIARASSEV